ncbi:MAG: NlpC/P60 family protein [Thermoleophilia bacterium]
MRSELAVLNGQLEAKVESYNAANSELGSIDTRIESNEAQLEETAKTLDVTQDRLAKRVVKIYRNGSVEVLDVLMETNDLNEFLTKFDMLTKVSEQDRDDFEQVKMLKAQVEEAQVQLASDKARQETLVSQLETEKSEIESGLGQRKQMLSGLESEIAALQAQEQAAQQAALNAQASSGGGGESYDGGGSYGPAPVSTAGGAAGIAMQYLGVPYVWGGASPSGMDCSGLVVVVFGQMGISVPRTAAAQYSAGTPISYGDLAPGDLVFFGYGGISHVGIYIGGGSMIHAPFEGEVVQIAPVSGGGSYRGAARY